MGWGEVRWSGVEVGEERFVTRVAVVGGDTKRHTPYAIRHTPYAIRHTPYAIRHTPYAIRHTPHVTRPLT